jgi:hypothetical protein
MRAARLLLSIALAASLSACLVVPKSRQRYLNDPTMKASESPLEDRARRKIHTAREGAGGGDGEPAGGGCACGN